MKRRELLKASALAIGYTALGGATFTMVNGCKVDTTPEWIPEIFSPEEMKTVSAVVDRIIPKTSTPGAIEAGIDRYLDSHLKNNLTSEQQLIVLKWAIIMETIFIILQLQNSCTNSLRSRCEKLDIE